MPMRGAPLRPSTASITKVCLDEVTGGDFSGALYNPYSKEPVAFSGLAAFLDGLEWIMDTLNFPQAYESPRTFSGLGRKPVVIERSLTRYMEDQVFETKAGKSVTFIVQVQFRQNATWQGTITWTEKKKAQHFRSTLEMIKLMDDAIEQARKEDGGFAKWED